MGTDNDARQQTGVIALSCSVFILRHIFAATVHPLIGLGKQIVINDLQLWHIFRLGRLGDDVAGVSLVSNQATDIDRLEFGPLFGDLFKDFPHPGGFLWIDLQVFDGWSRLLARPLFTGRYP